MHGMYWVKILMTGRTRKLYDIVLLEHLYSFSYIGCTLKALFACKNTPIDQKLVISATHF